MSNAALDLLRSPMTAIYKRHLVAMWEGHKSPFIRPSLQYL